MSTHQDREGPTPIDTAEKAQHWRLQQAQELMDSILLHLRDEAGRTFILRAIDSGPLKRGEVTLRQLIERGIAVSEGAEHLLPRGVPGYTNNSKEGV